MNMPNEVVGLQEFLVEVGVEKALLEHWLEKEWIAPQRSATGIVLTRLDLSRALLVRDLTLDMEVNDAGVDIVLQLLEQVHGLRRLLLAVDGRPG